jgi:hypothetical protein
MEWRQGARARPLSEFAALGARIAASQTPRSSVPKNVQKKLQIVRGKKMHLRTNHRK